MTRRAALLLAVALGVGAAAAARDESEPALGRIDFPTSGSPAAREAFLRGVLLLHSFEYEDAAEAFAAARRLEPGFALAYWGEAMTFNHPLWMDRDRDGALAVLEKLAPTREQRRSKAPTLRERMYLDAVEDLYEDGEKADRDRAYAAAMSRLHAAFPEDLEAASFYALALLGTCEGKRDFAVYMKAAAIAEDVFAKNPLHPGAVHYLIHSYDDPIHAPLGMRAARVYARIAPAAGHALHMPSHIFLASGMWDDVVASNEAAWKASLDRAERKSLGPDAHNYHALQWLEYAYLQQGRYADARRALSTIETDAAKSGSPRAKVHLALMRSAYLVETSRWSGDVAKIAAAPDAAPGQSLFVEGVAALERGDRAGAQEVLVRMKTNPSEDSPHAHAGAGYAAMRASDESTKAILAMELEARILQAEGKREDAARRAKDAAAAEDALSFEFGPPDVVKPAHELAGEMLLALGRADEARKEFQASLARAPRRALSLLGLARAAAKAGDATASKAAYAELRDVWRRADSDVAGLREAREPVPGS